MCVPASAVNTLDEAYLLSKNANYEGFVASRVHEVFSVVLELKKWLLAVDSSLLTNYTRNTARVRRLFRFIIDQAARYLDLWPADKLETWTANSLDTCNPVTGFKAMATYFVKARLDEDATVFLKKHCGLCSLPERLQDRHVLETASGKFGPSNAPISEGDLILYVPGGHELHVVSADARHYRGKARVEGYMKDDLLPILQSGLDDLETFHVL